MITTMSKKELTNKYNELEERVKNLELSVNAIEKRRTSFLKLLEYCHVKKD